MMIEVFSTAYVRPTARKWVIAWFKHIRCWKLARLNRSTQRDPVSGDYLQWQVQFGKTHRAYSVGVPTYWMEV